jgi:hypothetical protein
MKRVFYCVAMPFDWWIIVIRTWPKTWKSSKVFTIKTFWTNLKRYKYDLHIHITHYTFTFQIHSINTHTNTHTHNRYTFQIHIQIHSTSADTNTHTDTHTRTHIQRCREGEREEKKIWIFLYKEGLKEERIKAKKEVRVVWVSRRLSRLSMFLDTFSLTLYSPLGSISSTFFALFCTNVLFLVTFRLWTNFRTKNACEKRWWNWALPSISSTLYTRIFRTKVCSKPKRI